MPRVFNQKIKICPQYTAAVHPAPFPCFPFRVPIGYKKNHRNASTHFGDAGSPGNEDLPDKALALQKAGRRRLPFRPFLMPCV